jgi:hypothetical protein
MLSFLLVVLLVEEAFLAMVTKIMNLHVFQNLSTTTTMSTSFDLWMPRGGMNTFPLVVNHLNDF